MAKELNKMDLAKMLGISRPTLDRYLENGFPTKITNKFIGIEEDINEDIEYRKILLENEIRLKEYELNKLKKELDKLNK